MIQQNYHQEFVRGGEGREGEEGGEGKGELIAYELRSPSPRQSSTSSIPGLRDRT